MVLYKRHIFVFIMAVVLLGLSLVSANAADYEKTIISPKFSYINFFQNDFYISDSGKATVASYLYADNSDQVRITGYLQQYKDGDWKTVKNWTSSADGNDIILEKDWYVESGYTYRYISYGYVYVNGYVIESTSYESSKICY